MEHKSEDLKFTKQYTLYLVMMIKNALLSNWSEAVKTTWPLRTPSPNIQIATVILYNSFLSSKYHFLISILAELPKKDQVDIVLHSTKESFF